MIIRTAKDLRPPIFFLKKWTAEVTFLLLEILLSLEVCLFMKTLASFQSKTCSFLYGNRSNLRVILWKFYFWVQKLQGVFLRTAVPRRFQYIWIIKMIGSILFQNLNWVNPQNGPPPHQSSNQVFWNIGGSWRRPGTPPPPTLRPKMFSISCSFFGNFGKIICWRPPPSEDPRPFIRGKVLTACRLPSSWVPSRSSCGTRHRSSPRAWVWGRTWR